MLGVRIKNQASGTAHSARVNDRERRTVKRAERNILRREIRDGKYNAVQVKGGGS